MFFMLHSFVPLTCIIYGGLKVFSAFFLSKDSEGKDLKKNELRATEYILFVPV